MSPGTAIQEILRMNGIGKSFGNIPVLKNASLTVKKGEVHALMGENGAGKSTLMKILAGIYPKDKGHIFFKGKEVGFTSPHQAIAAGISMIHQELNLLPAMSIAENIFIGREQTWGAAGILKRKTMLQKAQLLLDQADIDRDAASLVQTLGIAERQMVEIIRAVSWNAEIIIMDEPTSSLSHKETEKLFSIIKDLKNKGVAIIYISHRMAEITALCDTITVLRDGEMVLSSPVGQTTGASLITAMVGRALTEIFPPRDRTPGETLLRVKGLSRAKTFSNISLTARKGEILGIAGLAGAGRTELVESIFGIQPPDAGEIYIEGKQITVRSPRDAMTYGMALVSEDRKQKGIIPQASVGDNITLSALRTLCRWGEMLDKPQLRTAAANLISQLGIRVSHPRQPVNTLSGGNQQKVVLARWLLTHPSILILDEPTRGIDIGARAEIYSLIDHLARQGLTIIMVSSEIPEILGLCDRILVMCNGNITAEMQGSEASQEKILQAAMDFDRTTPKNID